MCDGSQGQNSGFNMRSLLTVIDVEQSAILDSVVLFVFWRPGCVMLKEGPLKGGVVVVKVRSVCEGVSGVVVCVQVDEGTAAADEFLSEEKVNGFLC